MTVYTKFRVELFNGVGWDCDILNMCVKYIFEDGDCSVGIATRYGSDGLGIEFRWGGEIFHTRPDQLWNPPSFLYSGYRMPFAVVRRPGRVVDHPPHVAQRLKKG
jgi:hypothetical protein